MAKIMAKCQKFGLKLNVFMLCYYFFIAITSMIRQNRNYGRLDAVVCLQIYSGSLVALGYVIE